MEYLAAIIILGIIVYGVYGLFSAKHVDLHEERAELQANLEATLLELEELDLVISEEEKQKPIRPIKLLRKKVASKRHALRNTLEKVEIEGERNWEYRKLQAQRTMEAAKGVVNSDQMAMIESH